MLNELAIPIIQAPMLGATTAELAIAVSRAGGLGSLAAAGSSAAKLMQDVAAIRAATDKPFGVNIFIQSEISPESATVEAALQRLKPWRERYGLPSQSIPNKWAESFKDQFAALLEAAPPAASFTFGCLTADQAGALKARGTFVIGTATTVGEAKAWAAAGADAICAQGFEAGGHRGTFLTNAWESSIGTFALVRTIAKAVDLPVIAAGGIMDGAGIAAALLLGAAAVQLGTAYLLCEEAVTNSAWRQAIEAAPDDPTRLTRVISGRYARGIENEFMRALQPVEAEIPAYPIQNALTQDLRAAAAKANSPDVLSLWAGQGVKLARPAKAGDLTAALWRETREILETRSREILAHGRAE
ncbi:MAG: NAD(P)H-dependent flavin oxidoreductase [Beijerinckiaceae bacterium]